MGVDGPGYRPSGKDWPLTARRKVLIYTCAVIPSLFWGFSFIWMKMAYQHYRPITVVFIRLVLAAAFLSLFVALSGKQQKLRPGDFKKFLLLSFFEPFCYFLGESHGIRLVTPTTAAVIISTIPVVTPLLAYYFIRERLKAVNLAGMALSFCGVLVMVDEGGLGGSLPGILLLFFAVVSAVFYGVMLKKLSAYYSPFVIVRNQNLIGALLFLPLFLLLDWGHFAAVTPTRELVFTILNLSLFASTLAFLMITVAVRELGLSRTNIFGNLIPVVTAIFSFLLLGEQFGRQKLLGMALALAGLFISQLNPQGLFLRTEE